MEAARKQELQNIISEKMETSDEFCVAMLECQTLQQMQNIMEENNIDITAEEIVLLKNEGDAALQSAASGELSVEDLEAVSGGGALRRAGRFLLVASVGAGLGFVCGVCPLLTPHATGIAVTYAGAAALWVANG